MFVQLIAVLCLIHSTIPLPINKEYYNIQENRRLAYSSITQITLLTKLSIVQCATVCTSDTSCCAASYKISRQQCILDKSRPCEYIIQSTNGSAIFVKGCDIGWERYNHHCYQIIFAKISWFEAKKECKQKDANLVKIDDAWENEWIKQKTHCKTVWIGLTDIDSEGQWRWDSDSSKADFLYWEEDQPSGGSYANCVQFWSYGQYKWDDNACDLKNDGFVCEKMVFT